VSWDRGEPKSILVTRLRFTGDVILSTPLLSALARRYPGASVDYLCEEPHDQVLWGNPHLREIIAIPPSASLKETMSLGRRLRGRYDWILDLFSNPRSAWITALSGARLRAGRTQGPRALAYNHRPSLAEGLPATAHHLGFLESLAGPQRLDPPRIFLSGQEKEQGARLLADRGLGRNGIAILVGASQPIKEWPLENFVRLAALLRMGGRFEPIFIGQPGKRDALDRVRHLSHSQLVILPEMALRELAGVLANLRGLVSADGGVMHMAVALGLPTLAIFGPSDPGIWFPYADQKHAELLVRNAHCRPCHLRDCPDRFCLEDISPESAAEALARLLERA